MSIVVKVLSPEFTNLQTLVTAALACGLHYDAHARDFVTDRKILPCTGKFFRPGLTDSHQLIDSNDEIGLNQEQDGTWSLTWDRLNMDQRLLPLVGQELIRIKQEYQVARATEYCALNNLIMERVNNTDGTLDLFYDQTP
jgi:hypothetical protein